MLAKTILDIVRLAYPIGVRVLARQLIPPLLLSPVVFLGFVRSADFELNGDGSMLVVFLFAFQSGFFWQDVLAKAPAATPRHA